RIQEYAVTVYPDGNRHSTFLFVGENGKSVDLLDANGEMIVSGLYDIRFAQEYYHIFSKAISKYNSKRKSAPEIDSSILDGIIIARPDGGKNYGVYLLTGRQLVDPKFKSAEKAAQEFEKKFEKVFVSLIKNGEYEHDMEQMVQKIEKSRADRSASNLAALNATKPVYASKMEVVYPMVLPEMTTVAAAKGKTRSRSRSKKNSKAAKTYYFSGNKKLESQKFAEIRNEGLQYVVRPVGSKKYKLYNLYGLPLSDEEYDEIVGWGYNKDGDHLFKVRQGKLWGVVSPLGVEILTPQFEKIELTGPEENVVAGKRDGMYYAINGQTAALINNQPYDEIGTAFAKDGLIPVVRGDFETKIDARGIEHPSQAEKLLDEKIAEAWSKRLPSEQINELVAPFSEVFKLCTPNDTHLGGKYMNFMGEYSYTVWDNLDLAQSLFESAVKQGYAQAANNLETVKKEKKRRKMQTLMNGLSALSEGLAAIGQSAESAGASYSGDEGGIPSATTGMSESTYRDIYSRWERNAKSAYESLTMQGSRTSRGGKATSGTANGYWRHHYSGLKRNLRTAQSEMRKTRQEARRAGFTINQSNYETVTVAN
ncbi:MAG: hypothetical protein J6C91_10100, partial [Muribaculaceae bacterium]|nr:hypothetical protein [Muribaculaceae bacterium]